MSEIDFINQSKKNDKQKKEPDKSAPIEYSKPKSEEIDFIGDNHEKKAGFDPFGIIKAFRGSGEKRANKPVFSSDKANKELWKKVVEKRPVQPAVPSALPGGKAPPTPVPLPRAQNTQGFLSFIKKLGSVSSAGTAAKQNHGIRESDREIEEILLSKNPTDPKNAEKKKAAPEAPPKPPAAPDTAPDELDILQTNLIKDQSLGFVDWKRNLYPVVFSAVFPLFIIALAYGGIMYWGIRNIEKTKINTEELLQLEKSIDSGMDRVESEKVLFSEKKFPAVKYLIENHIYWTKLLAFLEDNTLETVYFNGFSGDTSGRYSLGANAESVKSAAEQIKALNANEWVLDSNTFGLSIGTAGSKAGGPALADKRVQFTLTLDLKSNIFKDYIKISE